MITDYLEFALRNIKHQKIRSWLTMIGIFIGIAAVVSIISIGQGLQEAINEQFEMIGTDIIVITPGNGFGITGTATPLTQDDLETVKNVKGVELAGGIISKIARVEFKGETKYTWVTGIPQDVSKEMIENMQTVVIEQGRDLKEGDKYKVIVGYLVAHGNFFEKEAKPRDTVTINGQKFKVVGNYGPIGNSQDDRSMFITLETAREIFDEPDKLFAIMVRGKPGLDPSDIAENIKERLREKRGLEKGDEDFSVQTSEQMKQAVGTVLGVVQTVLVGIAAVSLLVGGVGIMNTMYTSVLERLCWSARGT
jgi:putative ABC transport system permease protein